MFSAGAAAAASGELQIIQDEKFYSRLLSKENSAADPSFRVYYGVAAGSVPFLWESQPGTPKHAMAATTLPPLTPPPSYHSNPTSTKKKRKSSTKSPKHGLIHAILLSLVLRKYQPTPPRPPSASSSSASSGLNRRERSSSPISSFSSNSRGDDEEHEEGMSPTSTLCIGERGGGAARGCYSMWRMKDALLSIVGHGSNHGRAHAA